MGMTKNERRARIKKRIRRRLSGTAERPRMCVFRSNKQIYVQFVDDVNGVTLGGVSSRSASFNAGESTTKMAQAEQVGALAASYAKGKGIEEIVFDRNGYQYHGRVKALAESARSAGLKF